MPTKIVLSWSTAALLHQAAQPQQLLKLKNKKNDKVPDLLTRNICLTILRQEIWNIKILLLLLLPFTIV